MWNELTFVEARADCVQYGRPPKQFFTGNYSSKNGLKRERVGSRLYLKAPDNRLLVVSDSRSVAVV